jgi:hypothetical protein
VEEGEVVVGFAITADGDPTAVLQPSIRPLDRPALTGQGVSGSQPALSSPPHLAGRRALGDRLACAARLADPRLDLTFAQGLLECGRGIAAIGPQLAGVDAATSEGIHEREQMAPLVLVAGRKSDLERSTVTLYGKVEAASRPAEKRARDLLAPFFASTREASTITRDQSSESA